MPRGYRVHFPHAWVWLDAKAERQFDLVVVPTLDYNAYLERKFPMTASVRATGWLPRQYEEKVPPYNEQPGSRYYPIGGTMNRVRVVKRVRIDLKEDREGKKETAIVLRGSITPAFAKQRIRVDLHDPVGAVRMVEVLTDSAGAFSATFDLRYEPSLDSNRKSWVKAKAILNGTYRAQARIVAGDKAAEAESGFVFIKR